MKASRLALIPLLSALASPAAAQAHSPGGPRTALTRANGGGVLPQRGFHVPFFYPEREVVVVEREVIREVPAGNLGTPNTDVPNSPPPPRKPYVIGASYASLPPGCMKMVELAGTYFYCSGEWYRQVGSVYRAVKEP